MELKSCFKWISLFGVICCVFMMTGCCDKEIYNFKDDPNIKAEHTSEEEMARITIKDSYTKSNIKYYIFTTNVSGTSRFTLSEEDYDKFIGIGNDAVDCTVYSLKLQSEISEYRYLGFPKGGLPCSGSERAGYDLLDLMDDTSSIVESGSGIDEILSPSSSRYFIYTAYDGEGSEVDFTTHNQEYKIFVSSKSSKQEQICSRMELYHYSFIGEEDFTKDEIDKYNDVMTTVNGDISDKIKQIIN